MKTIISAAMLLCGFPLAAGAADLPSRISPQLPAPSMIGHDWSGVYGVLNVGTAIDTRATKLNFDPYSYDGGDVFSGGQGNYVGNANSIPNGQWAAPDGRQTLISHSYKLDSSYGYALSQNSPNYVAPAPQIASRYSDSTKYFGAAGLGLGYNQQFGRVVLGVAADVSLLSRAQTQDSAGTASYQSSSANLNNTDCAAPNGCSISGLAQASASVKADTKALGTLQAKVGYAFDRTLVFGTAGLAVGRVSMSSSAHWSDTSTKCLLGSTPGGCGTNNAISGFEGTTADWSGARSITKYGYALGGGVSYAVSQNIFLNMEAAYYNLGKASLVVDGAGTYSCTNTGNVNLSICTNGSAGTSTQPVKVASYTVSKLLDGVVAKVGIGFKY